MGCGNSKVIDSSFEDKSSNNQVIKALNNCIQENNEMINDTNKNTKIEDDNVDKVIASIKESKSNIQNTNLCNIDKNNNSFIDNEQNNSINKNINIVNSNIKTNDFKSHPNCFSLNENLLNSCSNLNIQSDLNNVKDIKYFKTQPNCNISYKETSNKSSTLALINNKNINTKNSNINIQSTRLSKSKNDYNISLKKNSYSNIGLGLLSIKTKKSISNIPIYDKEKLDNNDNYDEEKEQVGELKDFSSNKKNRKNFFACISSKNKFNDLWLNNSDLISCNSLKRSISDINKGLHLKKSSNIDFKSNERNVKKITEEKIIANNTELDYKFNNMETSTLNNKYNTFLDLDDFESKDYSICNKTDLDKFLLDESKTDTNNANNISRKEDIINDNNILNNNNIKPDFQYSDNLNKDTFNSNKVPDNYKFNSNDINKNNNNIITVSASKYEAMHPIWVEKDVPIKFEVNGVWTKDNKFDYVDYKGYSLNIANALSLKSSNYKLVISNSDKSTLSFKKNIILKNSEESNTLNSVKNEINNKSITLSSNNKLNSKSKKVNISKFYKNKLSNSSKVLNKFNLINNQSFNSNNIKHNKSSSFVKKINVLNNKNSVSSSPISNVSYKIKKNDHLNTMDIINNKESLIFVQRSLKKFDFSTSIINKVNDNTINDSKNLLQNIKNIDINNTNKNNSQFKDGELLCRVLEDSYFSITDSDMMYIPKVSGPLFFKMYIDKSSNNIKNYQPKGQLIVNIINAKKLNFELINKKLGWKTNIIDPTKKINNLIINSTEKNLIILINKLRHNSNLFARQYLESIKDIGNATNKLYNIIIKLNTSLRNNIKCLNVHKKLFNFLKSIDSSKTNITELKLKDYLRKFKHFCFYTINVNDLSYLNILIKLLMYDNVRSSILDENFQFIAVQVSAVSTNNYIYNNNNNNNNNSNKDNTSLEVIQFNNKNNIKFNYQVQLVMCGGFEK